MAHGRNVPLLPILQAFRQFYGIGERDDERSVREKIAGRMVLLDERFREALPLLFEFFGAPDPDRPAPRMDPEARQRQLFAILRRVTQLSPGQAEAGVGVVLIEDLHWIDPASEAFLAEWVGATGGHAQSAAGELPPRVPRRLDAEVLLPAAPAGAARSGGDSRAAGRPAGRRPEPLGAGRRDPRAHAGQPLLHRGGGPVADRGGEPRGDARGVPPGDAGRGARDPRQRARGAGRAHRPASRAREAGAADGGRDRQGVPGAGPGRGGRAAGRGPGGRAGRARGGGVHLRGGALSRGGVRLQAPAHAGGGAGVAAPEPPQAHPRRRGARPRGDPSAASSTSRPR